MHSIQCILYRTSRIEFNATQLTLLNSLTTLQIKIRFKSQVIKFCVLQVKTCSSKLLHSTYIKTFHFHFSNFFKMCFADKLLDAANCGDLVSLIWTSTLLWFLISVFTFYFIFNNFISCNSWLLGSDKKKYPLSWGCKYNRGRVSQKCIVAYIWSNKSFFSSLFLILNAKLNVWLCEVLTMVAKLCKVRKQKSTIENRWNQTLCTNSLWKCLFNQHGNFLTQLTQWSTLYSVQLSLTTLRQFRHAG